MAMKQVVIIGIIASTITVATKTAIIPSSMKYVSPWKESVKWTKYWRSNVWSKKIFLTFTYETKVCLLADRKFYWHL